LRSLTMPSEEQALPWLREQLGDEENARGLLTAAGGAPLKALALEQTEWFMQRRSLLEGILAAAAGRATVSQAVQPLLAHDPVALLDALYGWVSEALQASLAGRAPADGEVATVLNQLADQVGAPRLLDFAEQLLAARRVLKAGANPNRELLFEALVLHLSGVDAAANDF
jgi:DNA polymerase-3 subunit delta'